MTSSYALQAKTEKIDLSQTLHASCIEAGPLSAGELRIWFWSQLQPDSALYNIPIAVHLRGHLNTTILRRALDELVLRHDILRTRFEDRAGSPVRVTDPPCPMAFEALDIAGPELVAAMAGQAARPFDLAAGPLTRAVVYRLGEAEHVLLLLMHHIVTDGRSTNVLLRELAALYGAFVRGEGSPLAPLRLSCGDYAVWQQSSLQSAVLERGLDYWRRRLDGAPTALDLPTDRPRPTVQNFQGALHGFAVQSSLVASLRELARREGVTLFMVLTAAWQAVLSRWTGQEDIVIGVPVAGRRNETEELVGFFVNTLALRTDLSNEPTFIALLGRVREGLLEAYKHQDVPFDKIVEVVEPPRDMGRHPVFQACFNYRSFDTAPLDAIGLSTSVTRLSTNTVKFDLELTAEWRAGVLHAQFEYATDLFDATTIERLAGHLLTLLEAAVAAPQTVVSRLAMLMPAESDQLLVKWNQTATDYPRDKCVHEMFQAQVERTPEAIALVFESQTLTYAQLNRRSNQLAHHLRGMGVGPDVRVAICVERSFEMVIGLLAILKAGGAYVPLDPAYPCERLRYMLEDAAPAVVLTNAAAGKPLAKAITGIARPPLTASLEPDDPWDGQPKANLDDGTLGVNPGTLAYVIYTSGSTGFPKGVMVEHRSLTNHTLWLNSTFGLNSSDVVLQRTALSFDASIWEVFSPLVAGASVQLLRPSTDRDVSAISEALKTATVFQGVPALLDALADSSAFLKTDTLRTIFCGGDIITATLVQKIRDQRDLKIVNFYGPTETTIDSASYLIAAPDSKYIPIGRPIANTRFYVLDKYLQPVPIGVAGELHIGGAGLARGYLNRPEMTAERFVASPFMVGDRLYRTGDLVRYLPDGNLAFLGRADLQVKIRGFRIELGEIESRLLEHPAVREAVVVGREGTPGDMRLAAYYVPNEEVDVKVETLRTYLASQLPEHMTPAAYIRLEALPMMPNGKLDRKALPAPEESAYGSRVYAVPEGPVEMVIARIWAEVMGLEHVGRHDNFFQLGGHSLLAVRMISRVREAFDIEVAPSVLFLSPTLARFTGIVTFLLSLSNEEMECTDSGRS